MSLRPARKPVRVLHVVGSLCHGGIETWLMHMFRRSDFSRVRHEVILLKPEQGAYDVEAESLGVILHRPRRASGRIDLLRRLDRLLRREPFDVVHSHMYLFSGLIAGVAARRGVRQRIVHCHHGEFGQQGGGIRERLKRRLLTGLINRWATDLIGISDDAIEEIAGQHWRSNPMARVLLYGFDFQPFEHAQDRSADVRQRLGIRPGIKIVGHVGRFVPQKNHELLVESFARLAERRADVTLVLVGEGPLEQNVRARVAAMGLSERVRFAGTTADVAAYMAAFDVFVLTSRHEGLGIVAVEAQAAGAPSVLSDIVPREADVIPELITRVAADAPADRWADAIAQQLDRPPADRRGDWKTLEASSYAVARCVADLEAVYGARDA